MSETTAIYLHGKTGAQNGVGKPFFNYGEMTEGELAVSLVKRQIDLFAKSTNEEKFFQDSADLESLLNYSLHGNETPIQGRSDLLTWAEKTIRQKDFPAMAGFSIGQVTFQEWERKELEACERVKKEWEQTSWLQFRKRQQLRKEWEGCFSRVKYVEMVNEKFEESGHHILYNFAGAGMPVPVETKKTLHRIAIENYSSVLGLSKDNLRLWTRNGVIAQNLAGGIGGMTPESTIQYLKDNVGKVEGEKVGLAPALLIPLLIAIITSAASVTVAIMQRLSEQDRAKLIANTQGLGSEAFGPEKSDFLSLDNLTGSGAIIPLAIAAYLLISK